MWLSYIIPVYNCEKYIGKCLDSILNQGLNSDDFEIIVVNDGSTDRSQGIVEQYAEKHPNIRLINQSNQGVGMARNRGIDEAKGDFLQFVDADDYLLPDAMATIKQCFFDKEVVPEIFFYFSMTVDRYYNQTINEKLQGGNTIFSGSMSEYVEIHGLRWNVWASLFSRKFLIDNNLKFRRFNYCEDMLFMSDLFNIGNGKIVLSDISGYRYVLRKESASTRYDVKYLQDSVSSLCEIYSMIKNIQKNSNYRPDVFEQFLSGAQRLAFIRLCSLPPYKMSRLIKLTQNISFFSFEKNDTKEKRFINFVSKNPLLFYLVSLPMRYVFLPFIKPFLPRN